MTTPPAACSVLDAVLQQHRQRLLAVLCKRLDIPALAEDALQEACIEAWQHWPCQGLPLSPQAWLLKVAYRKALDQLRTQARAAQRVAASQLQEALLGRDSPAPLPDVQLRLIFSCCHPSLSIKSQVALTLRTVCRVPTADIASLFLDKETAMSQRLSRAKAQLARSGGSCNTLPPEQWPDRLPSVLATLYLIHTTGYQAPPPQAVAWCEEAVYLARLLVELCPGHAEAEGLLALMLLNDARRSARLDADGASVPPAQQNRALWQTNKIREGQHWLHTALARKRAGPRQLQAAISACHMAEPVADWPQIAQLYTLLLTMTPTPVIRLNHAVALAECGHLTTALHLLEALRPTLRGYQPFYAAEAALLARAGDTHAARQAYAQALALTRQAHDRRFLQRQVALLE